jgi:hypothetical protein
MWKAVTRITFLWIYLGLWTAGDMCYHHSSTCCHILCPPFLPLQLTFFRITDIRALGKCLPWPPSRDSQTEVPSFMPTYWLHPRKKDSGGNWGPLHSPPSFHQGRNAFRMPYATFLLRKWPSLVLWPMLATKGARGMKSGFLGKQWVKALGMAVEWTTSNVCPSSCLVQGWNEFMHL